jgi:hypothetical protein
VAAGWEPSYNDCMVKFLCDRCNTEVESPDDLIEIAIEGRERPSLAGWTWRAETCRACYESLKDAITALVDDTRRKPVRRASSS